MKSILVFLLFISFSMAYSANGMLIKTTANGGKWNDAATWEGGQIPSAGDDVEITSTVEIIGDCVCRNLTVNTNAILTKPYSNSNSALLVVAANLQNFGTISNLSPIEIEITVKGNTTNNGTLQSEKIVLGLGGNLVNDGLLAYIKLHSENGNVHRFSGDGKFTNLIINEQNFGIEILNNITFDNAKFNLLGGKMLIATKTILEFKNSQIAEIELEGKGTESKLLTDYNTWYHNVSLNGITIKGDFRVREGVEIYGEVVLADYLSNTTDNNFKHDLRINGKFINNGTLKKDVYTKLNVECNGSIVNNGTWICDNFLLSEETRHISSATDKPFQAQNITIRLNELKIEKELSFANSTITYFGCKTLLSENAFLGISNSKINGAQFVGVGKNCIIKSDKQSVISNSSFSNIVLEEEFHFDGKIKVFNQLTNNGMITKFHQSKDCEIEMEGSFINNGTIQNDDIELLINLKGSLINNNLIKGNVKFIVSDNVVNNGTLQNSHFIIVGEEEHLFDAGKNSIISCKNFTIAPSFENINNTSEKRVSISNALNQQMLMRISSDISFENTHVDFSNSMLKIDGNSTTIRLIGGSMVNIGIESDSVANTLFVENNAYIENAMLSNLSLGGTVYFGQWVELKGRIINLNTLRNRNFANPCDLDIRGDIINRGLIANSNEQKFNINCYGNIENYGMWENDAINVIGKTVHHLSSDNNSPISAKKFTMQSGNTLKIDTHLKIKVDLFDGGGGDVIMRNTTVIELLGNKVSNANRSEPNKFINAHVIAEGSGCVFKAQNPALISNVSFSKVKLIGDISVGKGVVLKDTIWLNPDCILQKSNEPNDIVVQVDGLIRNNGKIQNTNSYKLILKGTGKIEKTVEISATGVQNHLEIVTTPPVPEK